MGSNTPVDDDPHNCDSVCDGVTDLRPVCAQIGTDTDSLTKFGNLCKMLVDNCYHSHDSKDRLRLCIHEQ